MSQRKKNLNEYCHGCLAKDRPLVSIESLFHVFVKLMENEINKIGSKANVPKMCWECRAALRNSEKFVLKAIKAHEFLTGYSTRTVQVESLSNLSTVLINWYEIKEYSEIETNLKSNEVSSQEDIELKETHDEKFDDDYEDVKEDFEIERDIKNELELSTNGEDFKVYIKDETKEETEEQTKDERIPTNLKSNEVSSQEDIELKEENSTNDEKFDDDYEDVIEDFEIESDIKNELELSTNSEDFKVDIKDETKEETEEETKEKTKEERMQSMKTKFKIITLTDEDVDFTKAYKIVTIDDKERLYWMERQKIAQIYRTIAYKCELCITGFAKKEHYDTHVAKFHLKSSGKFECDICKKRFKDKNKLRDDIREHFKKYVCLLCDYECQGWKLKSHIKTHERAVMCLTCGLKFRTHNNFYEHYRRLHTKVICDYCGKKFSKKQLLIKHIRSHHSRHSCEICNRSYKFLKTLNIHKKIHHVRSRTEECYCVECNIQFDNITKYTVHRKTSVKHKNYPGFPCPVCKKVYLKKCYMTDHYRHVHLKKSPYYCDICSRYFINNTSLQLHKKRTHDKIPAPKNKKCSQCGRGFATNRNLNNHIRIHTGERPFECDICTAKFALKSVLSLHIRSKHKLK